MSIETIKWLLRDTKDLNTQQLKNFIQTSSVQLEQVLWKNQANDLTQTRTWMKRTLIQLLEKALSNEVYNEIIQPQQEDQNHAIAKMEVKKVDRLPLNAKLHLLKNNSLLNNIQLAFSDPAHYIEFHDNKFDWMKASQIQDEITWTIQRYTVIDPVMANGLLQKLWLPLSYGSIQKTKKILSDAKQHTYTTAQWYGKIKEKVSPRILYINGHPMMFGKNIVHVEYGSHATRAEKSKYDINTSAKLFNNFYGLVRSHDHIQASEQEGIQQLTILNELFIKANDILATNTDRWELIVAIQEIIWSIDDKIDATVVKAKIQDLEYIIQNTHIHRNKTKLIAAWDKIKKRISSQHSIKHTIELQQQALHEDLTEQEYNAKKYIQELQHHIDKVKSGGLKNISPRKIALSYEEKLYAKPFYDLRNHTIILDDLARSNKRINYTLIEKLQIDLLLQRWYINILNIENYIKTGKDENQTKQYIQKAIENFISSSDNTISVWCMDILRQLDTLSTLSKESTASIIESAHKHMEESWASIQQTI